MFVILTTDTPHHRYFINKLVATGFTPDMAYLDMSAHTSSHGAKPFETGPFFESEELNFEKQNFFEEVSYEFNAKTKYINSVNDPASLWEVKYSPGPHTAVVFGTGIIKSHVIDMFEDRIMNIHRGVAEEYRGLDSDLWAIYHNDFKNIGVTIHDVDSRLDTGDVWAQERLHLEPLMKIFQLRYYTTVLATEMLLGVLSDSGLSSKPQTKLGRYYSAMPLVLKNEIINKFDKHVGSL